MKCHHAQCAGDDAYLNAVSRILLIRNSNDEDWNMGPVSQCDSSAANFAGCLSARSEPCMCPSTTTKIEKINEKIRAILKDFNKRLTNCF